MSETTDRLRAQIAEVVEQLRATAHETLKEDLNKVFDKYGEKLQSFGWSQYTPGFNDGDPCYFTVGDDSEMIEINGKSTDDWDGVEYFWDRESGVSEWRGENKWVAEAADDVCDIIRPLIDNYKDRESGTALEILRQLFGNNVTVTATRDGFDTDWYDCGY